MNSLGPQITDPIPNAAFPTPGQGLVLGPNGRLPSAVAVTLPGYEFDYVQITAPVTINGALVTVVTGNTVIYDGATAIVVEFYCPKVTTGTNDGPTFALFDGSTQLGNIASMQSGNAVLAIGPVYARYRLTPSAGSHTYTIKASRAGANNSTVGAGSAASGADMPAFVRVTKA